MSDLATGTPSLRRSAKRNPSSNGKPNSLEDLLHALQAMRSGDFSVRMTGDHLGIEGKIADSFNAKARPASASSSISPAAPGPTWKVPSTR
jgi:hypothetical protein